MADEIDGDASGPTTGRRSGHSGRVQVIARMSSRRSWSQDEKLAILDEAFGAGGSVSRTAGHHAIGTGQIYTWRRLALDDSLGAPQPSAPTFARVEIAEAPPQGSAVARREPGRCDMALPAAKPTPALIEIELPSGVRVRVDGGVDGKALKRVLAALGAR